MSNRTLTDEQRRDIVRYRIESAQKMLSEVESHRENGFYNTAVNRMYYACYYAATAKFISMGIEVKSHDGVRLNLGKHVVMAGHLSQNWAVSTADCSQSAARVITTTSSITRLRRLTNCCRKPASSSTRSFRNLRISCTNSNRHERVAEHLATLSLSVSSHAFLAFSLL